MAIFAGEAFRTSLRPGCDPGCDLRARRLDAEPELSNTWSHRLNSVEASVRRMSQVLDLSQIRRGRGRVYFNRSELGQLLGLYFDRVAAGEWRDYAIDHGVGIAVFSVFRHSQDRPLYGIVKTVGPQGTEYGVYEGKHRLRRGRVLAEVLELFERKLTLVRD
jgi:hypothetical protein